jgi:signal transduction histidine kinase
MASPLLYAAGLFITELPCYILICAPFSEDARIKKRVLFAVLAGLALLRALAGFLTITFSPDWRVIDVNSYYAHALIVMFVLRYLLRVHAVKILYMGMLVMSLAMTVFLAAGQIIRLAFSVPASVMISGATMPEYSAVSAAILLSCFPFFNRMFRTRFRAAFEELPDRELWLLTVIPFLFFIIRQVFVALMGSDAYTDPSLAAINLLIAATGLISFYINMRTATDIFRRKKVEHDLTERNKMLDSLNLMKSEFMANLAHEIYTPLTVISGYAEQTVYEIEKGTVNADTTANLTLISDEAIRISDLANELLYSSENERTGVDFSPVNPAAILNRAAALCAPILSKNRNRLSVNAAKCPEVFANADMIVQALANICVNANRHTKNDVIKLDAEAGPEGMVTFTARDNGGGIPGGLLRDVFQRGVSGDGGHGLGLAVCKDIVRMHGGEIFAESGTDGTVITFTLPTANI